ncbi:MAG: hypothetical protein ACWA5X_07820 [bacterium]
MVTKLWAIVLGVTTFVVFNDNTLASGVSELNMQGMAVKADHELPNSLAIVPWSDAKPLDISPYEVSDLLDEDHSPVDAAVFDSRVREQQMIEGQ